jgi:hypothetical protein
MKFNQLSNREEIERLRPRAGRGAAACSSAWALCLFLIGIVCGFSIAVWKNTNPITNLSARSGLALEQILPPESFSEVENAKSLLTALSIRCITDVQSRQVALGPLRTSSLGSNSRQLEQWLRIASDLEKSRVDFLGTSEEMRITAELLAVLERTACADRWLNVYLNYVYQHPTSELAGRLVNEAAAEAVTTQREAELARALEHVSSIPLEFPGKQAIQVASARLKPGILLANSDARKQASVHRKSILFAPGSETSCPSVN